MGTIVLLVACCTMIGLEGIDIPKSFGEVMGCVLMAIGTNGISYRHEGLLVTAITVRGEEAVGS